MSGDLNKGGKRERTRARLIDVAATVFAEKGFQAATLDEIAERSGMTKGAIYGNFESKEALFLAIFDTPAGGVQPKFRLGACLAEQLASVAEAVIDFLPTSRTRGLLPIEFQLFVARSPAMRDKVDARTAEKLKRVVEAWRPFFPQDALAMPLEQLIVIVDAVIDGLLFQRAMTPSLVTDEVIRAAFADYPALVPASARQSKSS